MNILILLPILLALVSAFVVYFIKDRKYKNITLFALLSLVLILFLLTIQYLTRWIINIYSVY